MKKKVPIIFKAAFKNYFLCDFVVSVFALFEKKNIFFSGQLATPCIPFFYMVRWGKTEKKNTVHEIAKKRNKIKKFAKNQQLLPMY